MIKLTSLSRLLLVSGVLFVAGCAEWEQHMQDTLPAPRPAYADKEILVSPTRSVFSVRYAGTETAPSWDEQAYLAAFLDRVSPNKDAVVLVEQPPRRGERLQRQRAVGLTGWLRRQGYQTDVYAEGPVEEGVLHIAVDHMMAMVPNCPNWEFHPYAEFGAQPLPNQGCADRTNLAAMVVNPRDLVSGDVPHAPMGQAALLGEQRYRDGKITQPEDAQAAETVTSN